MNGTAHNEKIFSISEGGLVSHSLMKLNLNVHWWKSAFILLSITWLPVVIITAFEGTPLPFLKDVVIQGRILFGIPLLGIIGNLIYKNIPRLGS